MGKTSDKTIARERRHARVRRHISGTAERPRLAVFRSARHINAQVIDDRQGRTLASASTLEPDVKSSIRYGGNKDAATKIGTLIAERTKEKGIKTVVFDRGGFLYAGRVRALAEAARENGLEF